MVEDAALDWLHHLGYRTVHAREPGPYGLRDTYSDVVLPRVLRDRLAKLNPDLPTDALADASRKLTSPPGASLEARNRSFHGMLVDGVAVEYRQDDGTVRGAAAQVLDFDDPTNNDWLAVNQFTAVENKNERRPDIVLFVNGLPLVVIELKNPADEDATIWTAWHQLQTYKAELPTLFSFNEFLIVSDGTEARLGTLTAGREWFKPWRTSLGANARCGRTPPTRSAPPGSLRPGEGCLLVLRDFIVFEDDSGKLAKIMAGYHQFHAARVAVAETARASEMEQFAEPKRVGTKRARIPAVHQATVASA